MYKPGSLDGAPVYVGMENKYCACTWMIVCAVFYGYIFAIHLCAICVWLTREIHLLDISCGTICLPAGISIVHRSVSLTEAKV